MSDADKAVTSLARVFAVHASPWDQLLDNAAAIIGKSVGGGMCLIGSGVSASTVFGPVGVYHDNPERLTRINNTRGFVWPVSERAAQVIKSGEPFVADGSTDISQRADPEPPIPWRDALQESGRIAHVMVAIRFAGFSVGMVVVARKPPGKEYTHADAQDLEGPADVLALALRNLNHQADIAADADCVPQVTRSGVATLTGQERTVLVLVARGLTNSEIGKTMYLSSRTIEWYRARILDKLDHPTRRDLIALGRSFR